MSTAQYHGLLVVWEFKVGVEMRAEFERIYGRNGDWIRLFETAPGFIRSELVRDPGRAGRYLTLDFWESAQAYDRFRAENEARYHEIDARCEGLTESEIEVGRFERLAA